MSMSMSRSSNTTISKKQIEINICTYSNLDYFCISYREDPLESELIKYIKAGKIEKIKNHLKKKNSFFNSFFNNFQSEILKKDKFGRNALFHALRYNLDFEIINLIIKTNKQIVNTKNIYNSTPLMYAIKYTKNEKIINLLLDYKADITIIDDQGFSAFFLIIKYLNNINIIKKFIFLKAKMNIRIRRNKKNYYFNVLDFYLDNGKNKDIKIFELLTNSKVDFNFKNKKGNTPLMKALDLNYTENIVELLINEKTDYDRKNNKRRNCLMLSMINSHKEEIILKLIKKTSCLNFQDFENRSILYWALEKNYSEKVIEILILKKNCEINIIDHFKNSLLSIALKNNYKEKIIKLLINEKTNLNYKNRNGKNSLMIALENKADFNILKLISKNEEIFYQKDDNGNIALFYVLNFYKNDEKMIKYFLRKKEDILIKNKKGENCLFLAIKKNLDEKIIKFLINEKITESFYERDNRGRTLLMIALKKKNNLEIINILIKKKINI